MSHPPVFLVVGGTARNPARSGIQTVVRSLAAAFATRHDRVRLVSWNAGRRTLCPLSPHLSVGPAADGLRDPRGLPPGLLTQPGTWPAWILGGGRARNVALHRHPVHRHAPPGTWVLQPELMYNRRARPFIDYVHAHGWRVAAILHDTIPVEYPQFVPADLPGEHAEYLRALADADLILPNSAASAEGWHGFIQREGLRSPPVRTCALACDLGEVLRVRTVREAPGDGAPIRMLCVSTLEPRKNHVALLAAYDLAVAARPDLKLELDLVGAPYEGSARIEDQVRRATLRHPGVRWHGQVDEDRLRERYESCDFSVYPSVVEGFGLPVIESLWFGRPCVCADFGVMAENAAAGGCLTVDVRDPQALANAILEMAASRDLRTRLAREAVTRPLKTWEEYAGEVLGCITSIESDSR